MLDAVRVAPARQRLERDDRTARQVADRLEGEAQLALLDRAAQRGLHRELLACLRKGLGLIAFDLQPRLGALRGELRVADQLLGVLDALVGMRDADRTFDADLVIAQAERRGQHALDALGEPGRLRLIVVDPHQDPEFVATDSRQHVTRAQRPLDPAGNGNEQLITGKAAKARIQPPESVQVDDQHRAPPLILLRRFDRIAEAFAIGQAGQAVRGHLAA